MSKDEKEAIEEIIKRINERNEIGQLEDGYNYYFPSGKGGISSATLRIIAEELDRINLPYDTEINEYFKQEQEKRINSNEVGF